MCFLYFCFVKSREASLTDKEREVQGKSELLRSSLGLLRSLEYGKDNFGVESQPNPVRKLVEYLVYLCITDIAFNIVLILEPCLFNFWER